MRVAPRIGQIVLAGILAAALAGCASAPVREGDGGNGGDAVITAGIVSAFEAEPGLRGLQIDVVTRNGTVWLSGYVDFQPQAEKAGAIAGGIPGVKTVWNKLSVVGGGY